MEKQTQRIDLRTRGQEKEGEGEMCGVNNMETYITICKIDSQREFAVWLRKLKQGLCINLERWERSSKGRVYIICIPSFMLKLDRKQQNSQNSVNQLSFNKKQINLKKKKKVQNAVLGCNLKNNRMISVCFQGKPFNMTVIQVSAPTTQCQIS